MLDSSFHVCLGFIMLAIQMATGSEKETDPLVFTFPGTYWCGPGNISKNDCDLGPQKQTDSCCRTHDRCPDCIESGETKYNLTNDSPFTRLSCACDDDFRKCLLSVDMTEIFTAYSVGNIYYNMVGTKCFKYEYPIKRCVKYYKNSNNQCAEYSYDKTAPKLYQFFDVPRFQ